MRNINLLYFKVAVGNLYKNNFVIFAKTVPMCMRQITCEKNQAPLAPPATPVDVCKNSSHPNQHNQSEPGGASDEVSITAPVQTAGSSPPLLQWVGAMADKEPPNYEAIRKLPIPPLPTTANTTNTSKQKKTK